jgi:protein-L-isoaspartate(D-aspartate) O-methyltransferase
MNNTENDQLEAARQHMLDHDLRGRGIAEPRVLRAFETIRREQFVPGPMQSRAYSDGPLPIGQGQTISQPYIVALMSQELRVQPDSEILEIGTGSGYQTAVLSMLANEVYTIETYSELLERAKAVLENLDVRNVRFHLGDGSCGWPEKRTFDRIMITAAVPAIPQPLIDQLAEGGRLVAPVGGGYLQHLIVAEKHHRQLTQRFITEVRFVKLVGQHAFRQ